MTFFLPLWLAASPLEVPPAERGMKALELAAPEGLTLSASSCAGCHAASHQDWAGSRHASAATNALFTASFKHQTRTWCLNCHAPLSQQRVTSPRLQLTALGTEGVNCAACHVREGQVLSSRPATPAAERAHPMRLDPAAGSPELCASCHDFNVPWVNMKPPVQRTGYSDVPMQDTHDEWKASSAAQQGQGCVDCHGPHAVTGARDVAWLQRVLALDARATKDAVAVTLIAKGVGHAFPTGDPFRTLRFELCSEPGCNKPVATHWLQRKIARPFVVPAPTKSDDASTRFEVATASRPSHWRLVYSLAEPAVMNDVPVGEREVELLRGSVSGVGR